MLYAWVHVSAFLLGDLEIRLRVLRSAFFRIKLGEMLSDNFRGRITLDALCTFIPSLYVAFGIEPHLRAGASIRRSI